MRDILVTALVFGSLLLILRKPYIGILVWSWLSYMNPHRLSWGFAYNMPFAQIVAITLFVSILFSKDRKAIPLNGITVVWVMFLMWMSVTTLMAIYPDIANLYYFRIIKIQLVTFLTILLITDMIRLNQLIWVVVLSIGFFSIKGGVFTILSGGGFRVWGPPGSFIEENNALALSTLMILPMMFYLYKNSEIKWVRYFLMFAMASSFASAIGSQSRGALVATIAVGGFFWLKSSNKLVTGLLGVVVVVIGLGFMPDSWFDRMSTIQTYDEDASAMGRINAWKYSINIANDRLTGGGLKAWTFETFSQYAPNPLDVHAAHSIYFGVLGDHGWPGLILYLMILTLTWRSLSKIIRSTSKVESQSEIGSLAGMIKVSLVAFFSGGAFLSLPYFDLPWFFVAVTLILGRHMKELHGENDQDVARSKLDRGTTGTEQRVGEL